MQAITERNHNHHVYNLASQHSHHSDIQWLYHILIIFLISLKILQHLILRRAEHNANCHQYFTWITTTIICFFLDLSDFESETSPQKQSAVSQSTSISSVNPQPTSLRTSSHAISSGVTTTPVLPQQVNSSNKDTKPRIWSLADVAASKPSSHGGGGGPMHHSTSSVRHRPYPLPNNNNTTAFRPWFSPAAAAAMSATDSLAYRQLAAQSAALGNPLLTSALPTVGAPSSLRIPHVSTPSAHNPLLCTSSTVTPVSLNNHLSQSSTVLSGKATINSNIQIMLIINLQKHNSS